MLAYYKTCRSSGPTFLKKQVMLFPETWEEYLILNTSYFLNQKKAPTVYSQIGKCFQDVLLTVMFIGLSLKRYRQASAKTGHIPSTGGRNSILSQGLLNKLFRHWFIHYMNAHCKCFVGLIFVFRSFHKFLLKFPIFKHIDVFLIGSFRGIKEAK